MISIGFRIIAGLIGAIAIATPSWALTATGVSANLDVSTNYTKGSSRNITVMINASEKNKFNNNWGNIAPTRTVGANIASPNWNQSLQAPILVTVNIFAEPGDYFVIYMDHTTEVNFTGNFVATFNAAKSNNVVTDDINGVVFSTGQLINGLLNFAAMERLLKANAATTNFGAAIIPIRYYKDWTASLVLPLTALAASDNVWSPITSTINTGTPDSYIANRPFTSITVNVWLRASLAYPKASGDYSGTFRFALITQ